MLYKNRGSGATARERMFMKDIDEQQNVNTIIVKKILSHSMLTNIFANSLCY